MASTRQARLFEDMWQFPRHFGKGRWIDDNKPAED